MFKQFFVFVVCIIAMMIGNSMQQIPGAGGFAGAPAAAMGAGMAAAGGAMAAGTGAAGGAMGAGIEAAKTAMAAGMGAAAGFGAMG
nr:headcase protein homolog [Helicoverpa armigera]